nr:hypothetical protein [Paenibacillus larvae]
MLPTGYRIQTENDERTVQPSLTYDVNLKEKGSPEEWMDWRLSGRPCTKSCTRKGMSI